MMSKIIVGIDFSKSSLAALRLAVDIANRTGAGVIMAWVENKDVEIVEAVSSLEGLVSIYESKLKGKTITFNVIKGKVHQAIAKFVRDEDPDLLVIGAHGNGGFDERFAGQNTYKLAIDAHCPVLTVREDFNFDKDLEKIILPIDSTRDTRQKVPWTIQFAKMFPKSKIYVLGIQTSSVRTVREDVISYVNSVEKYLLEHGLPNEIEFVDSDNTTTAAIEYGKRIDADLVIIMTEQEKTLTNMFFLGPYTQQMLNLSPFPVLTIPPIQLHGEAR